MNDGTNDGKKSKVQKEKCYIKIKEQEKTCKPAGDQPKAIKELTEGIIEGKKFQTLLRSNRNR